MKYLLAIFITLSISVISYSQLITTSPSYPTENDSIVVYLDATQTGASEILNYSGTLYAHTGVYTNLHSDTWQNVIGTWGNNSTQPALTRLSTNQYKLTIGYPRQFYGITNSNEHITSLNFVFRTADGSKQTRPDIIYNLYTAGSYSIVLDKPSVSNPYNDPFRSPLFINQTDTVNIIAKAAALGTTSASITVFVNGAQKVQVSGDSLNYNFMASDYSTGQNLVTIVGKDNTNLSDTVKFAIMINPSITDASRPSGTELGINYNSDPTTITLALFAPHKSFVYLIGDFNNWEVNENYFMKRDSVNADSVVWWVNLTVSPGSEYAFQYLVDGQIRVADPFSTKILDQSNDPYITSTIYPNLKTYPSGKTSQIVSVFQTVTSGYTWQVTNFQKPDKDKLVIYELLVRDFVSTHWYKTIEDTLNYLKNLGVNAIEFMPVMEFEGNISWGYNPDFQMALDKYYGTPDAFKSLIDKAHSMGIAVILDVVLNHTMGQSPFARLYWDTQNNRPAADNPWLNPIAKHDYNVGNDFNHESNQTKYFVDRVTSYWIKNFHIDGYRFDLSKGFTQKNTLGNTGAWGHYDQSRINILERMANKIWAVDSTSILILEHFADNDEETVLSNFGFLLWGNLNYNYNQATMGYGSSDFSSGYYAYRGWSKPGLVTYMESHDEERLMYKNEQYGNSSGSYDIKTVAVGLNRMKEASAFFFLIPGPKMIWQFGELGYDYSINYPSNTSSDRLTPKPIRWDYFSDPARLKLYKTMSALISLKENYPTFSTAATIDLANSIKRITFSDTNMKVNIIGNFGVTSATVSGNFAQTGMWYDYFTGAGNYVGNTNSNITLAPGEFHIFTTVQLPTPDGDLLTDINENKNTIEKNYKLSQNFPNPFNPSTDINYQIPEAGLVSIKIYDLLGREIRTLVNSYQNSGSYSINFNAANLASGVYFYRISVNNFSSIKKMILMK